ncbi:hypothetical protein [Mycobacterium sp. 236(2023)]|uniref:hypothetical protein n=1 Tax=Mycobacterium sp. 236(2023) TaxID=3038163 RepID=UPI0024156E4A|nr:hypothetical protein [Mycobacterium sp. 236(2023)]MDG4663921.1 hypothetical protein [Mycobacterium sp. 236(2023)]
MEDRRITVVLASLGINSILGARFATRLFRESEVRISDEEYLGEWTAILAARVKAER